MRHFKISIECIIFQLAKSLGLFRLALKLTKNNYRILCYHSGSIHDEHVFWPGVFISSGVFKRHLQLMNKYKFVVLTLDEITRKVLQKDLPDMALALTFDDGFQSTKKIEPILKQAGYKATLYITSYYVTHQRPIFNVALAYLLFKTEKSSFNIDFNETRHTFKTKNDCTEAIKKINEYARSIDENKQNILLENIALQLQVDPKPLFNQRIFHNLSPEELKALHEGKTFDIQLHTHRHDLPDDRDIARLEIQKNRKVISDITGKRVDTLVHFCYPSGLWSKDHPALLNELGIYSATTLEPGLNSMETDLLLLNRIVCSDSKPLIMFEAEITGFKALLMNRGKMLTSLIRDSYGSIKGLFAYWFYKKIYAFKRNNYPKDWKQVKRLIFICSGNICRSAYAASYAKKLNMPSISYGLHVLLQSPAHPVALEMAKKRNINLSDHRSTNISHYKYQDGDLLVAFEPSHLREIKRLSISPGTPPAILLGQYYPYSKIPYIHDPYGHSEKYFEQCFSIIEKSILQIQHLAGNQKS